MIRRVNSQRIDLSHFDAAIVDLDGTMVDTLGDFVVALNLVLDDLALPQVDAPAVVAMVGKGSEHLIQSVLRHVGAWERVRACKGHFPATAAAVPDGERFALVHLDADLYKPTADALAFFYPRLSPGGFLILHDYGSGAWPGIAQAADAFLADKPESLVRIPDKSGTAIVRRAKAAARPA